MLAVIKTGGKQYIVSPGQKLKIEKLNLPAGEAGKKEGAEIKFDKVLLLEKNKHIEIGTPFIKDAKVEAKILSHGKGKKVIAFKYKAKKRYKVKKGHRQPYTEVEIVKLVTSA